MYGPSYIGWAPMGWYDCYRPYYDWAYRPYAHAGFEIGGGFYGRVRPGEVDLRPWTFVTPDTLMHRHIDQASLAADIVRERLRRDGNTGLVTSTPARFTRNEIRDPNAAVGNVFRRGIGSGTGKDGSGSAADMTPFFRRDPELSNSIRERVVRAHPIYGSSGGAVIGGRTGAPSGIPTPGTSGTLEGRINRGADGNVPRSENPVGINRDGRSVGRDETSTGGLRRGDAPTGAVTTPAPTSGSNNSNNGNDWRRGRAVDGGLRRGGDAAQTPAPDATRRETQPADRGSVDRGRANDGGLRRGEAPSGDSAPATQPRTDNWRGRAVGRHEDASAPSSTQPAGDSSRRDVPRRIIDSIGGARIFRGESPSNDAPRRETSARSPEPRSRADAPRDSGRSSGERSSPPPQSSAPPPSHTERSSPPPSHDSGSHESSNDHGHVKRDQR
jgi:hypothetical protein